MKWIIYTDLDGTLLDFTTYSYEITQPTVGQLNKLEIPLIFCSSKTRSEQEVYRSALNLNLPFIVENGSAILIPKDFFAFELSELSILQKLSVSQMDSYIMIALGHNYHEIRKIIEKARSEAGIQVKGYADLTLA